MDRATAARIRVRPEVVEIARENLRRWREQNDGELAPAHREWELILRFLTTEELADFLTSDTPKANRLRQSSPMAGILSQAERLAILKDYEFINAVLRVHLADFDMVVKRIETFPDLHQRAGLLARLRISSESMP